MKLYTVINNANSCYNGKFNTKEEAQALADKLNDEAIDRGNHQIFYNVELLDFEDDTKEQSFKPVSITSPKNPYRVEIVFNKPVKGLGSVVSFTAENLEGARNLAFSQVVIAKMQAYIRIFLNKDQYPAFNWERICTYTLNKQGEEITND
jgi:hypothetical protein